MYVTHTNTEVLLLLLLLLLKCKWILLGGSGTSIRHYTQKYTYHTKYHTTLKQNTEHSATRTINDIFHNEYNTKKYSYPCNRPWRSIGL
jgi:hypothetical protein